jgi:hypothetical protein
MDSSSFLGTVPGVPSLVTSRKMTLKLNYIYMKALYRVFQ